NWRFVFTGHSYGDLFAAPSPFQHMWSLAVEEQFYLFLPLVAVLALGRRGGRANRGRLAALLVGVGGALVLRHRHSRRRTPRRRASGPPPRTARRCAVDDAVEPSPRRRGRG